MGRLLLLLSLLHKAQLLTGEHKSALKDRALRRERLLFQVLEAFEADDDKDMAEAADTFRRVLQRV